jgi:hypothetical protein
MRHQHSDLFFPLIGPSAIVPSVALKVVFSNQSVGFDWITARVFILIVCWGWELTLSTNIDSSNFCVTSGNRDPTTVGLELTKLGGVILWMLIIRLACMLAFRSVASMEKLCLARYNILSTCSSTLCENLCNHVELMWCCVKMVLCLLDLGGVKEVDLEHMIWQPQCNDCSEY